MKKLIMTLLTCLCLTGCFEETTFGDTTTYTSIYPIEFITSELYGEYSTVKSIYPNGVDLSEYELTEKQKTNYASSETLVYNGLSDEVQTAVDFLNKNEDLHIIDAMKNMNYKYGVEELWLDPSHYLMVARNIKESLVNYEKNVYTQEAIEKAYENLKISISEIDVELTLIGKNASYSTLVVANDALMYLSKYNINVISVDKANNESERNLTEAKRLVKEEEVLYLYKLKGYELPEEIQAFVNNSEVEVLEIDSMQNLSEEQRKAGSDYISIMNENINNLKKELLR